MASKLTTRPLPHQRDGIIALVENKVDGAVIVGARGSAKSAFVMLCILNMVGKFLTLGGHWRMRYYVATMTGESGRKPWGQLKSTFRKNGPFGKYNPQIDAQAKAVLLGDEKGDTSIEIQMRPYKGRSSTELEGGECHLCVFEEAGSEYAYESIFQSIRPAVERVNGQMLIIGTAPPKWEEATNGWFRREWERAAKDPRWLALRWHVWDNANEGAGFAERPPTVDTISKLEEWERNILVTQAFELAGKANEIYDTLGQAQKETLETLAGAADEPTLRKRLASVLTSRAKTLKSMIDIINDGNIEEARRKFEGDWPSKPSSLSEEGLMYALHSIMKPNKFIFTEDGEMIASNGALEVWDEPDKTGSYVIGVDVGSGDGQDYSVATVIQRGKDGVIPAKVVAKYRTNTQEAGAFGRRCLRLAWYYNSALIVVERTGYYGVAVLIAIRDLAVKETSGAWIFADSLQDDELGKRSTIVNTGTTRMEKMGWSTNKSTIGLMTSTVRSVLNAGSILIRSQETYDELIAFDWKKNAGTPYDDSLFSLMVGLQAMQWVGEEEAVAELSEEEQYSMMWNDMQGVEQSMWSYV